MTNAVEIKAFIRELSKKLCDMRFRDNIILILTLY